MGAESLRPCRLRAFLSKSSIMCAQVNKRQSVLLPKMGGIVDCDSTRKAARKCQKLCICKSQPLFQTFTHYTLPHSWQEGKPYGMDKMPHRWLLSGGKTTQCGLDVMATETVQTSRKFWLSIPWAIMGSGFVSIEHLHPTPANTPFD
jgi:hypothetical protein